MESTIEIQAEEDYIPPYINYDNTPQDRDNVEMTFYTEVYAAAIRMADDTKQQDNHVTTVRRRDTSGISAPSLSRKSSSGCSTALNRETTS